MKNSYLTVSTVRQELAKKRPKSTWRRIGAEYGITGAMAYRIVNNNYEPRTTPIRAALGLPPMLPAPACAKCGRVHTTARCTEGKQPRRRWVRCAGHAGGRWE